jgi:UDPglucose--hexose-1-phosphate uridylyltransferase
MLDFQTVAERVRLVDPEGKETEQLIEHRRDPLTGTVASVNAALGEKARAFLGVQDQALIEELEERSRAGCPFCSAAERGTRFLPSFAPEGQLRLGRSLAMPNLFSKAGLDAVVIIDIQGHVLAPSRIDAGALATAIRTAADLVRRARISDAALVHHLVGMNFLPPGGSGVPHPHLQVHARGLPYSGLERLRAAGAAFRARHRRSYWRTLADQEREQGQRYLGRTGPVEWLAAFAPAHQKEVWGLLPGVGSLAEMDGAGAEGFAAGISRVITSYEEGGTSPFTLAFLSCPEPGGGGDLELQVRLCSRPAMKSLYTNYETWFAPLFLGDDAHTEPPERYAARLRPRFQP